MNEGRNQTVTPCGTMPRLLHWILIPALVAVATTVTAQEPTLVIHAVGDLSLPTGTYDKRIDARGAKLFDDVRPILASGDLNFVNIETAITNRAPRAGKTYAFTMPPSRLDWVLDAHFNFISLANNHITDGGDEGIRDTLSALSSRSTEQRPLYYGGVSLERDARYTPLVFEKNGVRIAVFFLGFDRSSHRYNPETPVHQVRDDGYLDAIAKARKDVDLVIVSTHFGQEYIHVPRAETIQIYRGFVDAGAGLVIGHHPHVIRGVEWYREALIIHSLGNFAFASRTKRYLETDARMFSMIARIEIRGGKVSGLRLHPLWVNNLRGWRLGGKTLPRTNFGPVVVRGDFAREVLASVQGWSNAIDGNKVRIEIESDVGTVRW
jgi:poly-gamma-glutamate capsule biosynthesis protein CapA/YwtB (metallophosphatase superfamily)